MFAPINSISLSLSYDRIKKMVVWEFTFVSEHLNTDQSQWTKCFALVACFACCRRGDFSFCDRNARSFTLWQQTIEITRRGHSIIVCSRHIYSIWVLFFAHISFVVNRAFNATPAERLQHHS